MKGKSTRKLTPEFKLKVALVVLKEKDTLATISKCHELHSNKISDLKKQLLMGATSVFETSIKSPIASQEPEAALLYE
jgi:transposase-like protein